MDAEDHGYKAPSTETEYEKGLEEEDLKGGLSLSAGKRKKEAMDSEEEDHVTKPTTEREYEKGLKTEYERSEEDVKGSVSLSAAGKRKMDSEEKDATERKQEKGSMSLAMASQVNKPTATKREGVTSYGKKMKMSKGDTKDDHGYKVELDPERDYDLWEDEIEVVAGAPSDTGSSDEENYKNKRADDYGEESDDSDGDE